MSRRFVPIFVDTNDRKIIVFGGGNVALRKCGYFRGSKITVMAKEILPELESQAFKVIRGEIPGDVRHIIDSYDMVIAATDNKALNDRILGDALFMGIDVNSAHGGGNILIPSMLKRDGYIVAVSSEGRAPPFPPYMVEVLDGLLDEKYDRMLDLVMEMRDIAKKRILEQHDRRIFLSEVINDPEVRSLVADDKMDEATSRALSLGGLR